MNLFTFTGNLGKDAELKTTQSGTAVLSFSVAVKSGYGDNAKTNWVHCAMFGKRAEGNLISYLKKGQQVAVSGEYELKEWKGQDGTDNKMPSVRVNEIDLIGARPESPQQQPQNQGGFAGQQARQAPKPQPQANNFDDLESDIPF